MTHHPARKFALLAALIGTFCCSPLLAKTASRNPAPPTFEWHDVKAVSGNEYRIIVWSPKGPAPAAGYPVVYVLDGNAWGPLVASILDIDSSAGNGRDVNPAIVVGIGYPIDEPFALSRRVWDLTTPTDKHRTVIPDRNGGYAEFLAFIEGIVRPDIERRYPIDRTRQTLLGHSLGGEFVLRTLLTHPTSFQNYVALSPSIWWDDSALLRNAKASALDAATAGKIRVYLGVGELEQHLTLAAHDEMAKDYRAFAIQHPEARQGKSVEDFIASLEDHGRYTRMVDNARDMQFVLASKGYNVRFDSFPDEGHMSVVPSELGRAIPFALKP